jgi:Ni/Fe-hydrogenase subunit HybB-like protein
MVLFLVGGRRGSLLAVRLAALMTLVGIVMNRLNISVIAFKWYEPAHYVPSWMELVVTAGVISAELWVFRWIVRRMPVLGGQPLWARLQDGAPLAPARPAVAHS